LFFACACVLLLSQTSTLLLLVEGEWSAKKGGDERSEIEAAVELF
jgi:hypothetical protein